MIKEKKGGSVLIEESDFKTIYILEDFDETSKEMLNATKEFVAKENYPNIK